MSDRPEKNLDVSKVFSYNNIAQDKSDDEDSRLYSKDTASRGRCEPGASRIYLNITSELRFPNRFNISRSRRNPAVIWETYGSMFRWFINESEAFVLYRMEAFLHY